MREKKCKSCKEFFQPTRSIQPCCNKFQCNVDYANKVIKKRKAKKTSETIKPIVSKTRREYRNNDYRHQFKLTKSVIQRWVNNVRDKGKPCISCGTIKDVQYCGGHYKTAGGNPEIALDTRNIHKQCNFYCNMNLSGNISGNKTSHGYTQGLIERYGKKYVDFLDSYHEPKNYTCEDLREIRKFYSKLIRENYNDDSELQNIVLNN